MSSCSRVQALLQSVEEMARLIAERLKDTLGRQVIVENKTGASGRLAVEAVKGAAPDGADCVDVAGVSLAMSKSDSTLDPTAGRSLDHIGFEVKNLPEFLKRMEAEGVTITQGLTPSNFVSTMRVAFIADPWGTKMEITEGIAPQP